MHSAPYVQSYSDGLHMSVQAVISAWSLCLGAERPRRIDPSRFSQHGLGVFLCAMLLLLRLCDLQHRCKAYSRRLRLWNDLASSECFNSYIYATNTARSSIAPIFTTVKHQREADVIFATSCVQVARSPQKLFGTHVEVYGHRPGL